MLHRLTGVTIGVTLVLMLLLKFEVLSGPLVTAGAVVLLLASFVLTAVSFFTGKRSQKAAVTAAVTKKTLGKPGDSPMTIACLYITAGDELVAAGKIDEAIAKYREGATVVEKELGPKRGPDHAMVFLLNATARDLEEAHKGGVAAGRK